jgi:UDP-N-acetylmuramate--alanine ligase
MPGAHNVLNALATIAVADELEIPMEVTRRALGSFAGVQRRFTIRGEREGVLVVDDYGHHPAEIAATLAGARLSYPERRVVAVFQPHRFTRVRDLQEEFARAFNDADEVLVSEIYAAGEAPISGVSGESLAEAIRQHGHKAVRFSGGLGSTLAAVQALAQDGDLVITLGAGNINWVGADFLEGGEATDG